MENVYLWLIYWSHNLNEGLLQATIELILLAQYQVYLY